MSVTSLRSDYEEPSRMAVFLRGHAFDVTSIVAMIMTPVSGSLSAPLHPIERTPLTAQELEYVHEVAMADPETTRQMAQEAWSQRFQPRAVAAALPSPPLPPPAHSFCFDAMRLLGLIVSCCGIVIFALYVFGR
jgi:hypothetical protein